MNETFKFKKADDNSSDCISYDFTNSYERASAIYNVKLVNEELVITLKSLFADDERESLFGEIKFALLENKNLDEFQYPQIGMVEYFKETNKNSVPYSDLTKKYFR